MYFQENVGHALACPGFLQAGIRHRNATFGTTIAHAGLTIQGHLTF
jgi:hypothetical protein